VWNLEWVEREGLFEIVSGEAAWAGHPLGACQGILNDIGLTAYLAECQHATVALSGEMFDHINWNALHVTEAELPNMQRVSVWLDPAVTSSDQSDCQGIQCDGLGSDGLLYRLFSWEGRTTPLNAVTRAIRVAIQWDATTVGIESDQGGDTWRSVFHQACEELRATGELTGPAPRFASEKAGAGHGSKMARAQRMLVDYERNKIRHLLGTHQSLELALMRFPKSKPFDLVDAAYWSWADLAGRSRSRARAGTAARLSVGAVRMN
jgi:phage terminase large subunit-like protein